MLVLLLICMAITLLIGGGNDIMYDSPGKVWETFYENQRNLRQLRNDWLMEMYLRLMAVQQHRWKGKESVWRKNVQSLNIVSEHHWWLLASISRLSMSLVDNIYKCLTKDVDPSLIMIKTFSHIICVSFDLMYFLLGFGCQMLPTVFNPLLIK